MMSVNSQKNTDNCEKFLNMMMKGKIPTTVAYHEILDTWERNFTINGISSGAPAVTLQFLIAQQARYVKNPQIPFRQAIGKNTDIPETAYKYVNMRAVAAYASVFNGLTFEDMGSMLTTGINFTREGRKQSKSPVEKVLAM